MRVRSDVCSIESVRCFSCVVRFFSLSVHYSDEHGCGVTAAGARAFTPTHSGLIVLRVRIRHLDGAQVDRAGFARQHGRQERRVLIVRSTVACPKEQFFSYLPNSDQITMLFSSVRVYTWSMW